MIFKSEIKGGRILAKNEDATKTSDAKLESTANGNSNIAETAAGGTTTGAASNNPAGDKLTNNKTLTEEEYKKRKASFELEFNELKAQRNILTPTSYAQKETTLYAKYSDIVDKNEQPVNGPINTTFAAAFGGVTGTSTASGLTPLQLSQYSENVNQVKKINKYSDY